MTPVGTWIPRPWMVTIHVLLNDECTYRKSSVVEMMGRLHTDLFPQDRFLLNGVGVKIRFVRSKYDFSLMVNGQHPDYKVQIVDAVLFARNAVLSTTVQTAHIKALEKGTAKYPIRPVDCKFAMFSFSRQAANFGDDATRPGIHEVVRQLCFVHNVDNHDVNYDFINGRGPM